MKTFSNMDYNDVNHFMEMKEYQLAYDLLIEMHEYAKNILLCESAYTVYFIAICHANLDRNYLAIDWSLRAKQLDPFNYDNACLLSRLFGYVEDQVSNLIPYGAAKTAEVEKIYQYLIEKGHVRSSLQFNMIRFYIKINELTTAREMLENYLGRNPNDEDAKFMYTSLDTYNVSVITKTASKKNKLKAI